MIRTSLYLTCDECHNPFPCCGICPSPVDGAIYTPAMLRREAKDSGWKRAESTGMGVLRDLCPKCGKKHAARLAALKGGK